VRFEVRERDARPAVVLDRVADVAMTGLSAQGNPEAKSLLRFIDSQDVYLAACRVLAPAAAFLRAEGAGCAGIVVDGGDLGKAMESVQFAEGATPAAAKIRG
jgi:hypothetical protein